MAHHGSANAQSSLLFRFLSWMSDRQCRRLSSSCSEFCCNRVSEALFMHLRSLCTIYCFLFSRPLRSHQISHRKAGAPCSFLACVVFVSSNFLGSEDPSKISVVRDPRPTQASASCESCTHMWIWVKGIPHAASSHGRSSEKTHLWFHHFSLAL